MNKYVNSYKQADRAGMIDIITVVLSAIALIAAAALMIWGFAPGHHAPDKSPDLRGECKYRAYVSLKEIIE